MTLPYVVVRSNNIALSHIDALTHSETTAKLTAQLNAMRNEEQSTRSALTEELYKLAGDNHPDFRQLLALKAKLVNDKFSDADEAKFAPLIHSLETGTRWLNAYQDLHQTRVAYRQEYQRACEASRASIKSLLDDQSFLKSISFTKGNISGITHRYRAHEGTFNKKILNDEDTLIKYLTRSIVKVSPFSGFTSIGFSKVAEKSPVTLNRQTGFKDRFSLDRSVFLKIFDALVIHSKHPWEYRFSNNVNDVDGDTYIYSFGDNKSIYPFRSALVKSKLPKLNIDINDTFSYSSLETLLGSRTEEKFAYLIDNGVLLFDIRLDDQADDILKDFKNKLSILKSRGWKFDEFEKQLDIIHQIFLNLPTVPVNAISRNVDDLTQHIHQLGKLVNYVSAKQGGIVYHDTLHDSVSSIEKPLVERFANQVSEFITHYTGVNYDAGLSHTLMSSLRESMLPNKPYSLFEFYDLAVKSLNQRHTDPKGNVGEVSRLLQFYQYLWQHRDSKTLSLQPVSLPEGKEHTLSAYGHVDKGKFILNSVDGGYLRVWSRFFTFNEDNAVLNACVKAYKGALANAYDFYDTFGFNTGRRPRLAKKRICLEQSDIQTEGDLSLNQLVVRWDEDQDRPRLFSKVDNSEVVLRHTALFVSQLYPRLLEVLMRFSMMEKQSFFAPRFGIYDMVVQRGNEQSVSLPRVVYKDIVVSRRQWWFKKSLVPVKSPSENFDDYLLRLDTWRLEHGMPGRVFVRRHAKDKVLQRDISNSKKPLFIDFHSPVMCRPVSRVMNSTYDYISFEEMLPDATDDFMQVGADRYASEIIVEKVA